MIIELHPKFRKSWKQRIASLSRIAARAKERIELFERDPQHPQLQDHALHGKKLHLRSFSVSGDIRIVYLPVSSDHVLFLDIGSHNQVY